MTEKHPFIEALTHDATVIQVPHLKEHRRTTLERFLSIFDQANQLKTNRHILTIDEKDYPESYHPVIRRLIKALQSPKIEDDMEIEDEVVNEFNKQARMIELEREKAEREQQRAEEERRKAEEERQKAERAKQREEEAKQREEKAKQREEKAKQREEAEKQAKNNLIKKLASMQMSIKEIAEVAGMEEEEVARLLKQQ